MGSCEAKRCRRVACYEAERRAEPPEVIAPHLAGSQIQGRKARPCPSARLTKPMDRRGVLRVGLAGALGWGWLQPAQATLARALRVDKMTYAALEATLESYAAGRAEEDVPVPRMIAMSADAIEARARRIIAGLPPSLRAEIVDGVSTIGGGSAPGSTLPTRLLAIRREGVSPDAVAAALRAQQPPVIARIENDRVLLDLRTVRPDEDAIVESALSRIAE